MIHDPLCQVITITKLIDSVLVFPGTDLSETNLGKTITYESGDCTCDLIARVREDERDQLFPQRWGRAEQLEKARVNGWHAGWNAAKDEFYAAALRDAVAAVKALEPLLKVEKYDGGYDCCGCGTLYDLYEDAITAIEDLGEKQ